MLEFSKRFGICLGIAAALCFSACGDDDSGSDGNSGGDASGDGSVACEKDDDCKEVVGKPVCDVVGKRCVEKNENGGGDGGNGGGDGGNGGGDGGNGGGETKSCADEGKVDCDGQCYDTQNDREHCGICTTKCGEREVCTEGKCVLQCESGLSPCGTECVDLKKDAKNCSKCGEVCSANICDDGSCVEGCPDMTEACDGSCIDVTSNHDHCGNCSTKCGDDENCVSGSCAKIDCTGEGEKNCGGSCINVKGSDALNCGECGKACLSGEVCVDGTCQKSCTGTICGDECVVTSKDVNHCGNCETKCKEGQVCNNGICTSDCSDENCTCDAGVACKIDDGFQCVDDTSNKYCGCDKEGAGMNCDGLDHVASAACEDAKCKITCEDGFTDCDGNAANGCEADVNNDVNNCGVCGTICSSENASSVSCNEGECMLVCAEGFNKCGGKCVNADTMKSDKDNCGFCGNKCSDKESCEDGFCVLPKSECQDDYVTLAKVVTKTGDKPNVKAYCITDQSELLELQAHVEAGTPYPSDNGQNAYILMADIEFVGSDDDASRNWKPIGTEAKPFKGIFIGNGKELTTQNKKPIKVARNGGFFGYVDGATLDGFNIKFDVALSTPGDKSVEDASQPYNVGALVGYAKDSMISRSKVSGTVEGWRRVGSLAGHAKSSTIMNSSVSGTVQSAYVGGGGEQSMAGFIGRVDESTVTDCSSSAEVKRTHTTSTGDNVSGFIAYVGKSTIKNCSSTGNVNAYWHDISGFIGYVKDSTVDGCSSSGNVINCFNSTPGNCRAGGFIGRSNNTSILNCTVSGDVTGSTVGDLIGSAESKTIVENCIATGNIVKGQGYGGGLIGYGTGVTVKNSKATGKVFGRMYAGGLAGYLTNSTVTGSSASGEVLTKQRGGGLVGFTSGSTYENNYATSPVKLQSGTEESFDQGGFVGCAKNSTFTGNYAEGAIEGTDSVGGFIGYSENNTINNCASYSNVFAKGNYAGSFAGYLENGSAIVNSYAAGDVQGNTDVGTFVGHVRTGIHNIQNSWTIGYVTGANRFGAFAGYVDDSNGSVTLYMDNAFWMDEACNTSPCNKGVHTGAAYIPLTSTYEAYSINDKYEPVLKSDDKLVDELNGDGSDWTTTKCKLDIGAGAADYNIPIYKGLKPSICE